MIRGFARRRANEIGNFYVDLTRSTLYILLPLSLLLAVILMSQGVVQSFSAYKSCRPGRARSERVSDAGAHETEQVTQQTIPLGPAASQIAIKQLGTNGGGFFNVNSAHPFENPTPLANFLEVLAILLIPAALCYTFGRMIGDTRQGWAILIAMLVIFVPLTFGAYVAEQSGNPRLEALAVDQNASRHAVGRQHGRQGSALRHRELGAVGQRDDRASNGSVNSMHDSFTPLGGLVPMWLMQLGEVVFGGVGSGLYGMLMFAVVAVFIGGLMVGRTPEYLGKKIESYEVKMASIVILVPPLIVLVGTAIASVTPAAASSVANPGGARILRNPLCVLVRRQQQRQRVRRAVRQHALLQHRARHRDVGVAVLADDSGAGARRQPGRKESDCGHRRHAAHAHAAVHHLAGRRRADGRCVDVRACARARPDRRASADDCRRTLNRGS